MASRFRPPKPPKKKPLRPIVTPDTILPQYQPLAEPPIDGRGLQPLPGDVNAERAFEVLSDAPLPMPEETDNAEAPEKDELSDFYVALDYQMLSGRRKRPLPLQQRSHLKSRISGIFLYTVLAIIFVGMVVIGRVSGDSPRHFFGVSAMRVVSGSMQSAIPEDSLVIIRSVTPEAIRENDDITFIDSRNRAITHRVIEIIEDYQGTGARGFRTKGVDNVRPDREIVEPDDIIGRVIFHNLFLGRMSRYISENVFLVGMIGVLLIGLIVALRVFVLPKKRDRIYTKGK